MYALLVTFNQKAILCLNFIELKINDLRYEIGGRQSVIDRAVVRELN
jgi:hypothetical protein